MKARKVKEYMHFGKVINYLRFINEGFPVHGSGYPISSVNSIFEYLDKFELKFCQNIVYAKKLKEIKEELEKTDESYRLTADKARKINKVMNSLNEAINAECSELVAYIIVEKRLSVEKLMNDVGSLMTPGIFQQLRSISQYDLQEAGRCIAFERTTAAAFHVLRGVEGTLQMFYELITSKTPVKLRWNDLILNLRKYTSPPPNSILDHLDNIRKSYRNPTAHPDKIYDIYEVQDLFSEALAVINQMMKYLNESNLI